MMSKDFNIYYVYLHRSKKTGEVFYVGKGQKRRAYYSHARSKEWKKHVLEHGFDVEIIASCLSQDQSFNIERQTIKRLSDEGVSLINKTAGGEGCVGYRHSKDHIEKLKSQNPMHNSEVREKISGPNSWRNRYIWRKHEGHAHTEETKKKIGSGNKGKIRTDAQKEFLRQRQKNLTQDQRARISESVKNLPKVECPHCGKVGDIGNMARWHFDNCGAVSLDLV
jgi:hypothetical protein